MDKYVSPNCIPIDIVVNSCLCGSEYNAPDLKESDENPWIIL